MVRIASSPRRVAAAALAAATALALALPSVAGAVVRWSGAAANIYTPSGSQRYSYAPSAFEYGGTKYVYTCHNNTSGVIEDHIYLTQINSSGTVLSSRSVLAKSGSGWDSFHVCDPSVVKGDFNYGGTRYGWALFYLANDMNCSCRNQIGVAFATSPTGPWVKYPSPIVSPTGGVSSSRWGVGQPSATVVDGGRGRVLLFYTTDDPADPGRALAFRRDVVLGDMSRPSIGAAVAVTTSGLTGTDGRADWLNGYDVAYDQSRDRFIATREMHPYPSSSPNFIGDSTQVVSIPGADIWTGGGSWTVETAITPALTGFPRNHNAGLLRTEYGMLPSASSLTAIFTRSALDPGSLWTYDLWQITGALS